MPWFDLSYRRPPLAVLATNGAHSSGRSRRCQRQHHCFYKCISEGKPDAGFKELWRSDVGAVYVRPCLSTRRTIGGLCAPYSRCKGGPGV